MKFMITYEYNINYDTTYRYWAISGEDKKCGKSFKDAKERLVEHLKLKYADVAVPCPEEIEI